MFPTNVALVPYEPDSQVSLDELTHVAAALQVQMVRDFGPIWGVSGTVSAFASLEAMPPGYLPLVVIDKNVSVQEHGFHFTAGGVPFGLVRYGVGWSLAASHEFLEMVCDPSGQRTMPGISLKDKKSWVDYLVEVCDPCEHSTYDINGIEVSDFVTPHYYSTAPTPGTRCSFLGRIVEPLQILGQGYISWRTRLPENHLWQAFGGPPDADGGPSKGGAGAAQPQKATEPATSLSFSKATSSPSRITRESADGQKSRPGAGAVSSGGPHYEAVDSSGRFGKAVRKDIGELLRYSRWRQNNRPPSIDDILGVIEDLAPKGKLDPAHRPTLDTEIQRRLDLRRSLSSSAGRHVPQQADYDRIVEYLKAQKRLAGIFGPDLMDPGMALWVSMHIL